MRNLSSFASPSNCVVLAKLAPAFEPEACGRIFIPLSPPGNSDRQSKTVQTPRPNATRPNATRPNARHPVAEGLAGACIFMLQAGIRTDSRQAGPGSSNGPDPMMEILPSWPILGLLWPS